MSLGIPNFKAMLLGQEYINIEVYGKRPKEEAVRGAFNYLVRAIVTEIFRSKANERIAVSMVESGAEDWEEFRRLMVKVHPSIPSFDEMVRDKSTHGNELLKYWELAEV